MFCKWCGGTVAPSEATCKRCGRELPALSDCGGFYDLVPSAKESKPTPIAERMLPPDTNRPLGNDYNRYRSATAEMAPIKKTENKQPISIWGLVALCCFAILFTQSLVMNGRIVKQSEQIGVLKEELQGMAIRLQELSEFAAPPVLLPEETPDAPPPEEPALKQQEVTFGVSISSEEDFNVFHAYSQLGDGIDTSSAVYEFDNESGALSKIRFSLGEVEDAIELKLSQTEELFGYKVILSYAVDNQVFAIVDKPFQSRWLYRIVGSDEWEALPEGVYTSQNKMGEASISLSGAELLQLVDDDGGQLELMCELQLETAEGGALRLVIEGVVLPTAASESFNEGID